MVDHLTYIQEIDAGVGGGGGWTLFQEMDVSSATAPATSNTLDSDVIGIKIVCHNVSHDSGTNARFQVNFTPTPTLNGITGSTRPNVTVTTTHYDWGTESRIPTFAQQDSFLVPMILEMWRWVSGSTHYWSASMLSYTQNTSDARVSIGQGRVALSSVLTNIKFDWSGGENFDSGVIRIYTQ